MTHLRRRILVGAVASVVLAAAASTAAFAGNGHGGDHGNGKGLGHGIGKADDHGKAGDHGKGAEHGKSSGRGADQLSKIDHVVVIYEENHSFDNLYGSWEGVNGLANADAAHTTQVDQWGVPYDCLFQNDVNLTSPPLSAVCSGVTPRGVAFDSHFRNTWFTIDDYIPATATTCPPPEQAFSFPNGVLNGTGLPGGCTRDIVHKFYQEIYQLNDGAQNRYATGSDAAGLVMGVYDTKKLPIYRYLHGKDAPHYAIADNFFQAAFGGSFLNHQWLIAAATPVYPGAAANLHSIVDSAGFPRSNYPLYAPLPGATYRDGDLTVTCDSPVKPEGACGDYAVNTMQPPFPPAGTFGDVLAHPQTNPTIGDRLSAAGVSWAWYSGGWNDAVAGHPDPLFQFHHQPFNYFANYAPGTPGRTHLKDETEFISLAQGSSSTCKLPSVSFVKPIGEENEHPGYASEPRGSSHLVDLLQDVVNSACAKDTMVIVTYDEFGGQWDHVPPPGQGGTPGPHDEWGPGTRIPALIVAPHLRGNEVVDHTQYDTTSILATIEQRWNLQPLGTRDAAVNSLANVFRAKQWEAAH